jgi:RNA polymerase sigma-70 factor (ECF subfamily)
LKLKYRTVIILRYFEDKAIAEIAEITRRRQGTVKSQLHRGLARLQDILIHRGILTP